MEEKGEKMPEIKVSLFVFAPDQSRERYEALLRKEEIKKGSRITRKRIDKTKRDS